jgi:5-methylcytosine-specific restriction endonuclease McrA
MARTAKLKEWIGKSDNHVPPATVRQRVFDRDAGKCHLCGHVIKVPGETWDLDHVVALINGGENRESNLAPAHKHCHVAKTARDVGEKSKVAAVRQKHTGASRPKSPLARKEPKPGWQDPNPNLKRRAMFAEVKL